MRGIDRAEQIEFGSLRLGGLSAAAAQIVDGHWTTGIDRQRLMALREKTGRPYLVVAARLALVHDNKARQIIVHRAQAVVEPRSHARHAGAIEPAHQFHRCWSVVVGLEMAGVDERHVVDVL